MGILIPGMRIPDCCMDCAFHAHFLDSDPIAGYDYEFCKALRRRFNDADDPDAPRFLSEKYRWTDWLAWLLEEL